MTITADVAPSGKVFDKWTTSDSVTFANASSATTTFTMPASNVAVTATGKTASTPSHSGGSALTVKLTDGLVTFDAAALAAVTDQAKGSTIQLNLDGITESGLRTAQKTAIKDMDVQAIYDAYLTSNGQRISDFKGGSAKVAVSYELLPENFLNFFSAF